MACANFSIFTLKIKSMPNATLNEQARREEIADIQQLIRNGKLRMALRRMEDLNQDRDIASDLILQHSRLSSAERDAMIGVVGKEYATVQNTQLTQSLLYFLEKIEEELEYAASRGKGPSLVRDETREILWFMATPADEDPLNTRREHQNTQTAIQAYVSGGSIRINTHPAAKVTDVLNALSNQTARMIHFGGHGERTGLILEDEFGESKRVPAAALSRAFATYSNGIDGVVLSACDTEEQAAGIAPHIPYVIGFSDKVADADTLLFSPEFYSAYARGMTIRQSFDHAKLRLAMEGKQVTADSLVLFERGEKIVG